MVLSQIPPLRVIIRSPKIRIVGIDQFTLYHYFGNVGLNLFLSIHNAGIKSVSISKIDCVIKNDEGLLLHLPAQMYYSRQFSNQHNQPVPQYFLGIISLKPDETWSETVNCFSLWSQEEEKRINDITSKIRENIEAKKQFSYIMSKVDINDYEAKQNIDLNSWTKSEKDIDSEVKNFFENKFSLKADNYHLLIAVISESNEILAISGYNFNLYEDQIQILRRCTERYKSGVGIYTTFDPKDFVYPRLKPINDELSMEEYKNIRSFLT